MHEKRTNIHIALKTLYYLTILVFATHYRRLRRELDIDNPRNIIT